MVQSSVRPFRSRLSTRFVVCALLPVLAAACGKESRTTTETPTVELRVAKVASSDGQTATVGTALAAPIAVKVVDQNNAPVASTTVTWKVLTGNGTLGSATSLSDAAGVATTTWTLGTVSGIQRASATLLNGKVDTLSATGTAAAVASLAIASDAFVQVTAGALTPALQVRVFDQYGNGVPNTQVRWSTTAGTLSSGTTTTVANGVAQVQLQTTTTPQDYVVRATVGGFTASISVRGQ